MKSITTYNESAIPSVSREHVQVWDMLPWMADGTATAEQRERVTNHLVSCAECRSELEAQKRLMRSVAASTKAPAINVDPGLVRLLGRFDEPALDQPAPSRASTRASRRDASRLTVALAAAVVVQAIGLGVVGLNRGHGGSPEYRTLSDQPQAAARASLQVVPTSTLSMAEWQALLEAHGLRVVDGPNAVGSYALAAVPPATQVTAEQLGRLRAAPGIRLAEPIGWLP